jgi:hypothetical protein
LVCGGQLDLHTAQKAIATDWITAYEKYCQSNTLAGAPLALLRNVPVKKPVS